MNNLKIGYLSCHFSGFIKLRYLLDRTLPISSIITLPETEAKKNRISGYCNFTPIAKKNKIKLYHPEKFDLSSQKDLDFFKKENFDILLISGWQRIVPEKILTTLKIGAIAEHGSSEYLPRGRGRSPINWSLILNRKRFVLHIFFANQGADSGEILDKENIEINDFDDIYTLYTKIALSSGKMFLRNLPDIANGNWRVLKQADIKPTYFNKRTVADDYICWESPTREIYNKIRAICAPYPGAKSKIKDKVIVIQQAQPFDYDADDFSMDFGEVIMVLPDSSFIVKTIDGTLLVRKYSFAGKIKKGDHLQ